jgi:hypothetical protein
MSRSKHSDSSDSSTEAALNDDNKWEDMEPDIEELEYVSLFDEEKFADLKSMFLYCKERYNFDFVAVQNQLGTSPE